MELNQLITAIQQVAVTNKIVIERYDTAIKNMSAEMAALTDSTKMLNGFLASLMPEPLAVVEDLIGLEETRQRCIEAWKKCRAKHPANNKWQIVAKKCLAKINEQENKMLPLVSLEDIQTTDNEPLLWQLRQEFVSESL